jgi:hypothetical protein
VPIFSPPRATDRSQAFQCLDRCSGPTTAVFAQAPIPIAKRSQKAQLSQIFPPALPTPTRSVSEAFLPAAAPVPRTCVPRTTRHSPTPNPTRPSPNPTPQSSIARGGSNRRFQFAISRAGVRRPAQQFKGLRRLVVWLPRPARQLPEQERCACRVDFSVEPTNEQRSTPARHRHSQWHTDMQNARATPPLKLDKTHSRGRSAAANGSACRATQAMLQPHAPELAAWPVEFPPCGTPGTPV